MPDRMPERLSEYMPKMSNRTSEKIQNIYIQYVNIYIYTYFRMVCQNIGQIGCHGGDNSKKVIS